MLTMHARDQKRLPAEAKGQPNGVGRRAVVCFQLASQQYGIPLRDIQEIVPMACLARSPALPLVLAGFLNLRGLAVAVIRLDRLLGLPEQPLGLYTPLLVIRHADPPVALLVDKVSRILELPEAAILPIREDDSFNGSVQGLATVDRQVVLLLSLQRLLFDKEHQLLAEFQDREQARLRDVEETRP